MLPAALAAKRPSFDFTSSAPEPAAVHGQDRAVNVLSGRRGKQNHGALEILGLAVAPSGDARQKRAAAFWIVTDRTRKLGGEVARRDSVDVYAERRPLVGQ